MDCALSFIDYLDVMSYFRNYKIVCSTEVLLNLIYVKLEITLLKKHFMPFVKSLFISRARIV